MTHKMKNTITESIINKLPLSDQDCVKVTPWKSHSGEVNSSTASQCHTKTGNIVCIKFLIHYSKPFKKQRILMWFTSRSPTTK